MRRPTRHGPWSSLALATLLIGLGAGAALPADDAQDELRNIEKELRLEYQELETVLESIDDKESVIEIRDEFREEILPTFALRYAEVARANSGKPVGLQSWVNLLNLTSRGYAGELCGEALNAFSNEYLEFEEMGEITQLLRYRADALGEESVRSTLAALAKESPHRPVKAAALLSLGAVLGENCAAGDPRIAMAKKVLSELAAYVDVEYFDGRNYAQVAASFVFALENLLVGMPCPDFDAVDAEGAGFKLSDYEGKVVLIDFWGFW
jgi:hypothetical protein